MEKGPVRIEKLDAFCAGQAVRVKSHENARYSAKEIVERAVCRLGESVYSLVFNNCEHFCEWCINGRHRSYQVEQASNIVKQTTVGYSTSLLVGRALLLILRLAAIVSIFIAIALLVVAVFLAWFAWREYLAWERRRLQLQPMPL